MIDTAEIEDAEPLREVEKLLWIWADWMQSSCNITRGYPRKTFYFVSGGKNQCEDFYEEIDINIGEVLDTIINDLPEKERAAINFRYLGHRYIYDSTGYDYVYTLTRAKNIVQEKAKKKGLIQ